MNVTSAPRRGAAVWSARIRDRGAPYRLRAQVADDTYLEVAQHAW
jgi:hypothetical protein